MRYLTGQGVPEYVKTLPHRAQSTPHGKAISNLANAVNDLVDHIPVIARRVGQRFEETAKQIEADMKKRQAMNQRSILDYADNYEQNYDGRYRLSQPAYTRSHFEGGRGQGFGFNEPPPRFSNSRFDKRPGGYNYSRGNNYDYYC